METRKLNKLAGIPEKKLTTSEFDKFLSDIQHPMRSEITRWRKNLKKRRLQQDFYLKDIVHYKGNPHISMGKVIEVVKAGRYPNSPVRVRGYYKDYISYVILTYSGQYRWCSGARLALLERKIKGINSKSRM